MSIPPLCQLQKAYSNPLYANESKFSGQYGAISSIAANVATISLSLKGRTFLNDGILRRYWTKTRSSEMSTDGHFWTLPSWGGDERGCLKSWLLFRHPREFKIKSLYSNDLILNIASKSKETVQKLKFFDSPLNKNSLSALLMRHLLKI